MDHLTDDRRPFALVVDDEPLIRMEAMDILSDAGFRPLEAHCFETAEALLVEQADEITLLFTDVQIGGVRDGYDLARLTAERWPDIRILVASGTSQPDMSLLPEGLVFVRKPFSAKVVYDRLQELLPEGKKPEPLRQRAPGR